MHNMKSIATAAVLACLAVNSASAFVSQSASTVRTTSALAVSFEDELGAQKPLGYW
jgi:hypothetical protein